MPSSRPLAAPRMPMICKKQRQCQLLLCNFAARCFKLTHTAAKKRQLSASLGTVFMTERFILGSRDYVGRRSEKKRGRASVGEGGDMRGTTVELPGGRHYIGLPEMERPPGATLGRPIFGCCGRDQGHSQDASREATVGEHQRQVGQGDCQAIFGA